MARVANYCAKYCLKSSELATPAELRVLQYCSEGIIPPTFRLMSKGIGVGYIQRMKRFHVPFNKNLTSKEYVSKVVDRRYYYDGTFRYKLPRFFADRLYRKKFPCKTSVYNPKTKQMETKTVFRFKSKNMLSLQMQVEIRDRVLADFNKRVAEYKLSHPAASDTEASIAVLRAEKIARLDRQKTLYSKLARFYNYNRFKHNKI